MILLKNLSNCGFKRVSYMFTLNLFFLSLFGEIKCKEYYHTRVSFIRILVVSKTLPKMLLVDFL